MMVFKVGYNYYPTYAHVPPGKRDACQAVPVPDVAPVGCRKMILHSSDGYVKAYELASKEEPTLAAVYGYCMPNTAPQDIPAVLDIQEWLNSYAGECPWGEEHDILDFGYWTACGEYSVPCKEWRNDRAEDIYSQISSIRIHLMREMPVPLHKDTYNFACAGSNGPVAKYPSLRKFFVGLIAWHIGKGDCSSARAVEGKASEMGIDFPDLDYPDELTDAQIERLDYVHNTIYDMLCDLSGQAGIEWDMEYIGQIEDVAQEFICKKLGIMTEMEFSPYVEHK